MRLKLWGFLFRSIEGNEQSDVRAKRKACDVVAKAGEKRADHARTIRTAYAAAPVDNCVIETSQCLPFVRPYGKVPSEGGRKLKADGAGLWAENIEKTNPLA